MFLIGATGPMRRWLALRFCEALRREVEVQSLTRDTTEADLKQVSVSNVLSLSQHGYRLCVTGTSTVQQSGRLNQVQDLCRTYSDNFSYSSTLHLFSFPSCSLITVLVRLHSVTPEMRSDDTS